MPVELIVPRLGWSMEEGALVKWLKQDGEVVRAGEPLFSIEGDKAVQEIESIDSGILRITANGPKPGDPIHVGDMLGYLLSDGESDAVSPPTTVAAAELVPPEPLTALPAAPVAEQSRPLVPTAGRPAISPRALRVAGELGVDWTTITGTGRTGRIRERDVRAAVSASQEKEKGRTAVRPFHTSAPENGCC